MIERPEYIQQITPFAGKKIIKVLVGVRRCGKSTLLDLLREQLQREHLAGDNLLHMRFESEQFTHIDTDDKLASYVREHVDRTKPVTLLFDEIQEVDHWERALRSFLVDYDADIYITGSNARVLSSDLATYITGRYVTINVYPLSFKEFLPAFQSSHPDSDVRGAFRGYVAQGGFPFQHELEFAQDPTLHYLQDLTSTILLKDVVRRNAIRDVDLLERLVRYAIAEEGHPLTPNAIASYLKSERRKTSQETVSNYLNAVAKAYLLYRVPRIDAVGKRALQFNEKYYVVDQGIRQALGYDNTANIDQTLENIVCMELLRRGYAVSVGAVGDKEIDFVASRGGVREYYQVSYLTGDERTRERELSPLEAIPDNYPKTVLSLDEFPYSRNGINGQNIIDWLLQ